LIKPGGATTGGNKIIGESFARLATGSAILGCAPSLRLHPCSVAFCDYAIARQQIKSIPGLIVELDTFAAHEGPLRLSTALLATVNPVFRGSAAL
jgi:hypothetical protein